MTLITFHFKSKHPTDFIPVLYGSLPELGGGKPENGIQMEPTENLDDSNNSSYNFILEVCFSKSQNNQSENISSDWYSYSFKPPFGLTFRETAPHRHFPEKFYETIYQSSSDQILPTNNFSLYDTEGIINPISDCLLIRFKLNKHVDFGTEIFISGNCDELGNWAINDSKQLSYIKDGQSEYWTADIKFPLIAPNKNSNDDEIESKSKKINKHSKSSLLSSYRREIEYKYFLSSSESDVRWEPEENHKLLISFDPTTSLSPSYIEVNDTYRYTDNVINVFSRSAFVNVINKRGSPQNKSTNPELHLHQNNVKPGHVLLTFIVNCPFIKKRQNLTIVGNIPELGEWSPLRGLKMSDCRFPYWTASIVVKRQNSKFNYKYVIEDTKYSNEDEHSSDRFIWENREDRECTGVSHEYIDSDFPASIAMNDWYVSPHVHKLFKGVTVNVPLFSLKTENSCGIGSYSDLKFVVDICRASGCSMIQLMPINDTIRVPFSVVIGKSSTSTTGSSLPNSGSMGNFRSSSKSHFSHTKKGQGQNGALNKHVSGLYQSRGLRQSSSMAFNDFTDDDSHSSSISNSDIWSCSNPYNIVSVFALNPIYINLQDVLNEEIQIASKSKKQNLNTPYPSFLYKSDNDNDQEYDYKSSVFSEIQNEIIAHRCKFERNEKIDFPEVLKFKLSILKKIFVKLVETRPDKYDLENDEDYNKFTAENEGWLKPYSVFCCLRDKYNTCDFKKWSNPIQHYSGVPPSNYEGFITSKSDIEDLYQTYLGTELSFISWLQYVCDKQMKSAKEYASAYSIALKVEMPYFIPFDSSDCWAFRNLFDFDNIAGSPPDMRCIEGQNYNVPVLRDWTSQTSNRTPILNRNEPKHYQSTPDVLAMQQEVQRKREQLINGGLFKNNKSLLNYKSYYPSQIADIQTQQTTQENIDQDEHIFPLAENWWTMRMKRMSSLFDAAEIDNTLNLFRNWVIPKDSYRAVTGYFSPSNPLSKQELDEQIGFNTMISQNMNQKESTIKINEITIERLTKPYIRYQMIRKKFDDETPHIISQFFTPRNVNQQNDFYDFQERCNSESKINDILYQTVFDEGRRDYYRTALFQLLSNVILIKDKNNGSDDYQFNNKYHIRAELTIEHVEGLNGNGNNQNSSNYNFSSSDTKNSIFDSSQKHNHNVMNCTPRTTFSTHGSSVFPSSSWLDLEPEYRQKLLIMCNDYFYGDRNKKVWLDEAKPKLKLFNEASQMLVFSNDFNEISAPFEKELENYQVIKYNVPRYPRNHPNLFQVELLKDPEDNSMNNGLSFMKCEYFDYLSQCVPTPATEDCLRSWWEKNRASTIEFWQNEILDKKKKPTPTNAEEKQENWMNSNRQNPADKSKNDIQNPVKVINDHTSDGYFFLSPDNSPQIPPEFLEPWIQETLISKYLSCRSMWCTFMLQDLVAILDKYRRQYPNDECVHRPDQGIKWQYRYPFKLEEVLNDGEFIGKLRYLIERFERL